jgi:hypothetical protein
MRASVPDWEVCRIWWRGPVGEETSAPSGDSLAGKSAVLGMWRVEVRRCVVTGKWPVWKVDLWSNLIPPIDLGSVKCMLVRRMRVGVEERGRRTFGIEL